MRLGVVPGECWRWGSERPLSTPTIEVVSLPKLLCRRTEWPIPGLVIGGSAREHQLVSEDRTESSQLLSGSAVGEWMLCVKAPARAGSGSLPSSPARCIAGPLRK